MKSYYIESLGCAKNLVDSETFAYVLEQRGYRPIESAEGADVVILNTCAFLQRALAELDDVLCQLAELKNQGQIGRLFVSGCVMNRALEDFQPLFHEVDAWIPLKDFARLEELLDARGHKALGRVRLEYGHHAYLRISDGCSNRCSYCTIPSIRGALCSVPIDTLVAEARSLAEDKNAPCTELIVIAQDTCSYGKDIYGKKMLPELLTELLKIDGIRWIRVMYMHPDHFETDWLTLWQENPKLLPYFEIPVQHSEDRILKAMNRKKSSAELIQLFSSIREALPDAALRSTLICGYPGESRGEALALHKFVRETGFHHLGAFCYSPEPGTPAFEMPDQIPSTTAERRRLRLLSMHRELSQQILESYIGRTIEVLIDDKDPDDEEQYVGRAWFQAPDIDGRTFVQTKNLIPGSIVRVRIDDVIDLDLFGDAVSSK